MKRSSLYILAAIACATILTAPSVRAQGYQLLRQNCPSCAVLVKSLTASTVTASTSVQTPLINGPSGTARIQIPSNGTTVITSTQASGGGSGSPGTVIDTTQAYGGGDHILSLKTAGSEKAFVNGIGTLAVGGLSAFNSGSFNFTSATANGASAIAFKMLSTNALSTTGAKMLDVYSDNGTTEQAYLIKDANGWNWRVEGKPVVTFNSTGANPQTAMTGISTLSAGALTVTFGTAFAATPACTCTDRTAVAAVKCTSSTTQLFITGTSTDVVGWICIGDR